MTDDVEPGSVAGFETAADQLSAAIDAIRDVDLNLLLDEDVRTVLDAKADLQEICLRHRQNQHAAERTREQRESEP